MSDTRNAVRTPAARRRSGALCGCPPSTQCKPAKDVHKDAPGYDLTFKIETKDGKQFSQNAKCYPDRYTYTCPVKAEADTAKDFYVTRAGDNALTIRDRAGKLTDFFGVKLGNDDRLFRLEASAPAACTF